MNIVARLAMMPDYEMYLESVIMRWSSLEVCPKPMSPDSVRYCRLKLFFTM